jgi:uncharacterized integral membrane protein
MTSNPAHETQPADSNMGSAQNQAPARGTPPGDHVVRRTRIGGIWVAAALFALVLLLLLIFILENGQRVSIGYFGAHGHLPLGVALLLAAVLGILLVVVPGTARIIQLRMVARRHRRLDAKTAAPVEAPPARNTAPPDQNQP